MTMLEAMAAGFTQATSWEVLPYLFAGSMLGLILGVIPGLGGHFAMAMVVPVLYLLSPPAGIAFLLASHATVAQGGGLTTILFNTPGCGQNAATLLDGPAMRKRGLAGRATGAALTACFLGAAFGAVVLALLLPLLQWVVLRLGPAETFMLIITALGFVMVLGKESPLRGAAAGLGGVLLATVGVDVLTNQQRFTFDLLSLRDGLPVVPVILGLFGVSELLELWADRLRIDEPSRSPGHRETQREIFRGVRAALRRWWLVIRCGTIGTLMGLIPGLGSTAAAFVAYGHARQTSDDPDTFGQGNIEGVIGPESANDAVEGGALASTVALGIPGSSSMAIVLAGLAVLGVSAGPDIVNGSPDLIMVMVFTVVVGNFAGTLVGLFLVNPLSRLSQIDVGWLIPVLLTLIATGAYAARSSVADIVLVIVLGALGYLMKRGGYPRSLMLIGFVMGLELERNLHLSLEIYGPTFLLRPAPLALGLLTISLVLFNAVAIWRSRADRKASAVAAGPWQIVALLVALVLSVLAGIKALDFHVLPGRMPLFTLACLVPILALLVVGTLRSLRATNSPVDWHLETEAIQALRAALWLVLLLALIALLGHYLGICLAVLVFLVWGADKNGLLSLAVASSLDLVLYAVFEWGFGIPLATGWLGEWVFASS